VTRVVRPPTVRGGLDFGFLAARSRSVLRHRAPGHGNFHLKPHRAQPASAWEVVRRRPEPRCVAATRGSPHLRNGVGRGRAWSAFRAWTARHRPSPGARCCSGVHRRRWSCGARAEWVLPRRSRRTPGSLLGRFGCSSRSGTDGAGRTAGSPTHDRDPPDRSSPRRARREGSPTTRSPGGRRPGRTSRGSSTT
jgi:hypothetical protein